MALSVVEKTLQGIFDRIAFQQAAANTVVNGGTKIWDRVDAAANETFENRVKGIKATALDAAFAALPLADMAAMRSFLGDITAYVVTDLGLTSIDTYLTAQGWRIDQRMASFLRAASNELSPANVYANGDAGVNAPGLELGNFLMGTGFVDTTNIDPLLAGTSALLARITVIGTAAWTLTVTAELIGGATKTLTQVVAGTGTSGAVGDVYVLGKQAINGTPAAGQKTVQLAATAQFEPGQTVLLTEFTGVAPNEVWTSQEKGIIATVQANTSITLVDNLKHAYTTGGFAYPCFAGVSNCSGSGGIAGNRCYFYPAADRRLKL